jgi:hypothetical protein
MKHCASIFRAEGYAMPNTEHGSGTFLENITEFLPVCTASHLIREHSLKMAHTCPITNIIIWGNVKRSV